MVLYLLNTLFVVPLSLIIVLYIDIGWFPFPNSKLMYITVALQFVMVLFDKSLEYKFPRVQAQEAPSAGGNH